MAKVDVYNEEGKSAGTVELPESVFGLPWNANLIHQVVVSLQSTQRDRIAHTKNRGEVRGGGKKPWRQKGTGRARHGSRRSPIWRGGGVTFGPRRDKMYDRKVNKKMLSKAVAIILSRKLKDKEVIFVDALNFAEPKTKKAKGMMESFGKISGLESLPRKRKNALLLALPEKNKGVEKSFSNFGNIEVGEVRNLNPLQLMTYKYVMFVSPDKSVAEISKRVSN